MRAWDYPKEKVVIACQVCRRRGVYPKERFIELVGTNTQLADALTKIAHDCPNQAKTGKALDNPCKAVFPEL